MAAEAGASAVGRLFRKPQRQRHYLPMIVRITDARGRTLCTSECPLLAQSGHPDRAERCLLLGVKRTLRGPSESVGLSRKYTLGFNVTVKKSGTGQVIDADWLGPPSRVHHQKIKPLISQNI
jgi:hypothetical protein